MSVPEAALETRGRRAADVARDYLSLLKLRVVLLLVLTALGAGRLFNL